MGRCHITRQAGPPTIVPLATGDHYVDTTNNITYLSRGTSSSSDWVEVGASDIVTTLSFNSTTNVLSYVNESGTTVDIDLTFLIDDTNLARVESGILDSLTGIATFTRDDSSTFTMDFSSLNDQAAINAAITAHEAAADPHTLYETTAQLDARDTANRDRANHTNTQVFNTITNAPVPSPANAGQIFLPRINAAGTGYEFFAAYDKVIQRLDGLINDNTPFETFIDDLAQDPLGVGFVVPEPGQYMLSIAYRLSLDIANSNFLAHAVINGTEQVMPLHIEPTDSAGTGQTLPEIDGGVISGTDTTGTDQFLLAAASRLLTITTAGRYPISIEWAPQVDGVEATIYEATMRLTRIPS